MNNKIPVVFVTSVFGDVHNGPAVYANLLWEALRDAPEIEFHLVTPVIKQSHPRLHASGQPGDSRKLYAAMQGKAIEIANSLSTKTIVHGNAAHSMSAFTDYPGPVVLQVNDYDAARAVVDATTVLRRFGPRRLVSLVWRRHQERAAVRTADCVVCNSEFVRAEMIRRYRLEDDLSLIHISEPTRPY